MSLLQRIDVYPRAGPKPLAFRSTGFINSDVSEVTETDEDVLIRDLPEDVLERAATAEDRQVITKYVDSEKWCGDERTKYAVVKVEATSFVVAVIVALAALVVSVMFLGP